MKRRFLLVACVLFLGCSSSKKSEPAFDHFEYSEISVAPGTADLQEKSVLLAEGVAVKAVVKAIDERGHTMSSLDIESGDPNVVGVEHGPEGSFVFYGSSAGSTELHVLSNETRVGSVSAQVIPE
jgi:hypothetical protein